MDPRLQESKTAMAAAKVQSKGSQDALLQAAADYCVLHEELWPGQAISVRMKRRGILEFTLRDKNYPPPT